jgi:hypothetical protein
MAMTPRNRRNRLVARRDRRFWYGAAAAIVMLLLLIGWALGWFTPSPEAPATG